MDSNQELSPKHCLDEIDGIKYRLRIGMASVRDMGFLVTYASKYFKLKMIAREQHDNHQIALMLKDIEIGELVRQLESKN